MTCHLIKAAPLLLFLLLPVHAQSGNAKNDQRQKNANATQNATPKTVPTQTSPQTADKPATKQPDREYPVNVSKIPDVTIHRDLIDYLMLVLTAVLAIVGIVGTCYALQTLRAIKTEVRTAVIALKHSASLAHAAQKVAEGVLVNANIAKQHADAVMQSERAWLLIREDKIQEPYLVPPVGARAELFSHCIFFLRNSGKTPALVVAERYEMQISNDWAAPPQPERIYGLVIDPTRSPYIIPQDESTPREANLVSGFITEPELERVNKRENLLWLCGFIRYRDVFERDNADLHETRFCYVWETRTNAPKPYWHPAGPDEYNKQS